MGMYVPHKLHHIASRTATWVCLCMLIRCRPTQLGCPNWLHVTTGPRMSAVAIIVCHETLVTLPPSNGDFLVTCIHYLTVRHKVWHWAFHVRAPVSSSCCGAWLLVSLCVCCPSTEEQALEDMMGFPGNIEGPPGFPFMMGGGERGCNILLVPPQQDVACRTPGGQGPWGGSASCCWAVPA